MGELTEGISWLGVIVGAVAAFLLGWAWYSPMLFGRRWAEGVGVEMGPADQMPVAAMATQLLGLFLMSWFVGVTATDNALFTVILATLAFTCLSWSGALFTRRPAYVRLVDAGYWIVALIVMIVAQGVFRGMAAPAA